MTTAISKVIPNSKTVVLEKNPFYSFHYDHVLKTSNSVFGKLLFYLRAPFVFSRLASESVGFIYIGSSGALISEIDQRLFEFRFLKKVGLKIVCYFVGSDIRSYELSMKNQNESGEVNYATYLPWLHSEASLMLLERTVMERANIALSLADTIFSAEYDQASYLNGIHQPALYFYPTEHLFFRDEKFSAINTSRLKILHAPSSPILKGSQIIHSVVKRLQMEGFDFEYKELIGAPHSEVLDELSKSHIVINELFAFMPGLLSIEAMAHSCAVLTRADPNYEVQLRDCGDIPWLITPAYLLYENLVLLLGNPEEVKQRALAGFDWVKRYASSEESGKKFRRIIGIN